MKAPPLSRGLNARLSGMMFLQYAIWGAWLPLFYRFLDEHHGFESDQIGILLAIAATGALIAPFVAGQIADRWFSTEKFLGISHLLGAVLVWQLGEVKAYGEFIVFGLLYSLLYAPTLPLTNSLAFHHLPDRDRDFGKVRVWGTIGWIVVGIGIGQWLLHRHTPAGGSLDLAGVADTFRFSAVLGAVLGLYCFTLPHTPPQRGRQKFAPGEALQAVIQRPRLNPLFWLFLITFPVACIHQFYFVHTAGFLGSLKIPAESGIKTVFGEGGIGLMTIGQMAEILVLAAMPFVAKRVSRKRLLAVGLLAYIVRFAVFAFAPDAWAVIPALALHGLCFGCFLFVAFMIVDEETPPDVRASAQGLFNLIVVGFGVIVGNIFAGYVADAAKTDETTDYATLFGVPMVIAIVCLGLLLAFYPRKRPSAP